MKISIITQYFPPENGAAAQRVGEYAHYLSRYYDIHVYAPEPTHMITDTVDTKRLEESFRTTHFKLASRKGYSFLSRLGRELQFALKIFKKIFSSSEDSVLLVSTPSPFLAYVAFLLSFFKKKKYILDVRDMYPQVIHESKLLGKRNPIYLLMKVAMVKSYRSAHGICYVNKNWSRYLSTFNSNTIFIPNGISGNESKILKVEREDLIVYSGNLGKLYNFDPILDLAAWCGESDVETLQNTKFKIIGTGVQEAYIKERIHSENLGNVTLEGPYSKEEVDEILQRAKIGIVSLDLSVDSLRGAIPNKIYDYLENGLRVVAVLPETLTEDLVPGDLVHCFSTLEQDGLNNTVLHYLKNFEPIEVSQEKYPTLYRKTYLGNLKEHFEQIVDS